MCATWWQTQLRVLGPNHVLPSHGSILHLCRVDPQKVGRLRSELVRNTVLQSEWFCVAYIPMTWVLEA